jgi:hypothetical protein
MIKYVLDDQTRGWLLDNYKEMRFTDEEAEALIEARADWHLVDKAVKNGCAHKQVVNLLT